MSFNTVTPIDILYSQFFNQLMRTRVSRVYLEKKMLEEIFEILKKYVLDCSEKIREKIKETKKYNESSYLTWDIKYLSEYSNNLEKQINEYQEKIKNSNSSEFLEIDPSEIGEDIKNLYPEMIPVSKMRELFYTQWKNIKEKQY